MTDTVLVTGGTGYVARACIAELLQRGYDVRTTVRDLGKDKQVRDAVRTSARSGATLTCVVADLTADAGWDAAMAGCRHVLHVASPLGVSSASTPEQLIETARGGTLRVLKAAARAHVERVVMTSAANAASPSSYAESGTTDETLWTDPTDPTLLPYRRSKTLAEKAAWEFMETVSSATTLTTILPGAVFGPVLSPDNLNSVQIIGRLLRGEMPGIPRIGLEIVDVRDLADIHIRAMTSPAAAGQRFLATGEFMWLADVARVLREALGPAASKVPTRAIPNFVVRLVALAQPQMREIAVSLGRRNRHSIAKARNVLGWAPRPAHETVVDCAKSLIEWKLA